MIELEDQAAQEDVWAEAAPADARKNVKKKKQIKVSKDGKMGDIAHYHHKENEFEEWEEPCPYVEFRVIAPGGIQINQRLYAARLLCRSVPLTISLGSSRRSFALKRTFTEATTSIAS